MTQFAKRMACMRTDLPQGIKFVYPDGGLFTWVDRLANVINARL